MSALLYASVIHTVFLSALWAYLRIFLARPVDWHQKQNVSWTNFLKGAPLPRPPREPPKEIKDKLIIFECDETGEPIRCHRDQCRGRWKPARSRHCGDCRECRVALDHHCPWFDADVSAPQTMLPFLTFLALIPPLLSLAYFPLLGISYHSVRYIWRHACQSPYVDSIWWSRRRSWIGGPMYRWLIGFWLGSRECCSSVDNLLESPNLYIPVMLTLAVALIFVSFFLLLSTLQQLSKGDLTIDDKIRKSVLRQNTASSRKRAQRYFFIPSLQGQGIGSVISLDPLEQPYDLGNWKDNLRAALCLPPYTMQQLQLQWPISASLKARLVAQANTQAIKDR